jgi:hypothetical protein
LVQRFDVVETPTELPSNGFVPIALVCSGVAKRQCIAAIFGAETAHLWMMSSSREVRCAVAAHPAPVALLAHRYTGNRGGTAALRGLLSYDKCNAVDHCVGTPAPLALTATSRHEATQKPRRVDGAVKRVTHRSSIDQTLEIAERSFEYRRKFDTSVCRPQLFSGRTRQLRVDGRRSTLSLSEFAQTRIDIVYTCMRTYVDKRIFHMLPSVTPHCVRKRLAQLQEVDNDVSVPFALVAKRMHPVFLQHLSLRGTNGDYNLLSVRIKVKSVRKRLWATKYRTSGGLTII